MAALEMDSFLLKFKNLWKYGKNANLTIKSCAGKAEIVLSVELGEPDQPQQQLYQRSRNGQAWQRRCEKRTATREAAATDDAENVAAVEATHEGVDATVNVAGEVVDELCSKIS